MNKTYLQFVFDIKDENVKDILIAQLSDIGFNGFEEHEKGLIAFIDSSNFVDDAFNNVTDQHNISFSREMIAEQNWNSIWEENFQPVIIRNLVAIRAHFHQPITTVQHEIIITPKMSFGTGHHATTYLMLQQMQDINFSRKTVLDFGTGTGILAIMAELSGAKNVVAIDNDEWSINNAKENFAANNCNDIL